MKYNKKCCTSNCSHRIKVVKTNLIYTAKYFETPEYHVSIKLIRTKYLVLDTGSAILNLRKLISQQ